MEEPVKDATDSPVDPLADKAELNAEQRALLRSLHKSFQQAARGGNETGAGVLRGVAFGARSGNECKSKQRLNLRLWQRDLKRPTAWSVKTWKN